MKRKVYCGILVLFISIISIFAFCCVNISAIGSEATDEESILLYDKIFIGVGDEHAFDLQFEVDYYYITTINSSIVSVMIEDSVYKIVGVAPGKTSILVNYRKLDGTFTSNICEITVLDNHAALNTETYYIYSEARKYLILANITNKNVYVQQWASRNDDEAAWSFTPSGKYYYIHHPSLISYLGVDDNGQLHMYAAWEKAPTLWRIYTDPDGRTIIVPQEYEYTNVAVGTDGVSAYLSNYYNDVSTKRWHLITQTVYLDNYYDSSAIERLNGSQYNMVIARVSPANTFAAEVFNSLGVAIQSSNSYPIRKTGLLADLCPRGNNFPCDSSCETIHKNTQLIYSEISQDIPRDYQHITVFWADRRNAAYNDIETMSSEDGEVIAFIKRGFTGATPVVNFVTISKFTGGTITAGGEMQALMCITLAHELAHIYGIEGEPAEDMVDDYGNKIHTAENGVQCIMNYMNFSQIKQYYDYLLDSESPIYFCNECLTVLQEEIPKVIHIGN